MHYVALFVLVICYSVYSSFASPKGSYEELIVELRINYEYSPTTSIVLQFEDGSVLVPIKDIGHDMRVQKSYLLAGETKLHDIEYVNLKDLDQATYSIDRGALLLDIQFPPKAMEKQYLNANEPIPDDSLVDRPVYGAYINYDVNVSNTKNSQYVAGIQDIHYFTKNNGNVMGSFFLERPIAKHADKKTIRLDTNWTLDSVDDMARWRIGDSTTKNADWSSSSRFAGLQYATNFDIDPGLVTYPLIDFAGSATLPSTIDVYTRSRSLYRGEIKPGEFEVGNIPIPTGAGDFTVQTRDITGKLQEITMPYYISPILLKKGLSDYSFAVGVQRQSYTQKSNQYRNSLANMDYMHGINNYWTAGPHFEMMDGRKNGKKYTAGVTNKVKLNNYGVVSTSVASNLHKGSKKAQKFLIDYSYNNSNFNIGTRLSINGKRFEDTYIDEKQNITTKPKLFGTIGFVSDKKGMFSINYLSTNTTSQDRIKILSASYSRELSKNDQMRVTVGTNLINKKDNFITLSYNINLSNSRNLTTEVSREGSKYIKQAQFSSSNSSSGLSYRGSLVNIEKNNNYNLNVAKRTNYGTFGLSSFGSNNSSTQQLGANGSLVFMDKDFYFSEPIYSSLVTVRVGEYKDVPVYNNNHFVANTNKKGKVFVPNVIPFATSKIRIDANSLPLDAHVVTTTSVVAPNLNSGILVDFDIKRYRSVVGVLVDKDGRPFEENHVILIEGLNEVYSGYDGQIYLEDIGKLQTIKGAACKHGVCYSFDVDIDPNNTDVPIDLGAIYCKKIEQ